MLIRQAVEAELEKSLMQSLKALITRRRRALAALGRINEYFDEVKINQGAILSTLNQDRKSKNLKDYEFKIFSQWGEDGIIQHLIKSVEIRDNTFIEFGVQDFLESNCRFLLIKDRWKGFVLDGSKRNIERLKGSYFYWKHHLEAIHAFITRENINELLARSGFGSDLGILSIDMDGVDYYILEAIENFNPRILICEYNSVFGATRRISVPYRSDFRRRDAHRSNLYWGASLGAMTHLAQKRGYALVGTNTAGNNAFYVRSDLLNDKLQALSAEAAYAPSGYRESRDEHGALTYVPGDKRLELIRGMPVFNVETATTEPI